MRLKMHRDPMWLEHGSKGVDNLFTQAFLHGKTPSKQPHEADEFGNTFNVLVEDVSDMGMAMKRKRMMFTEGKKRDRPLDHLA